MVTTRSGRSSNNNSDQQEPVAKRQKAVTDDLICPITHELPFDPVLAEDGRVYERSAIEQHISHSETKGYPLKSPMTNACIGPRLFASPQIKNLIGSLIENRSITGELVDTWKKKEQEKKDSERLLKEAQDGDAVSMYAVYEGCKYGMDGFKKDLKLALHWVKKAHAAGFVEATSSLGFILVRGRLGDLKVKKDQSKGLVLMTTAAMNGSDCAAYRLGSAFFHGKYDLSVDKASAVFWLEKALCDTCLFPLLKETTRASAQEKLEELNSRFDESSEDDEDSSDDEL